MSDHVGDGTWTITASLHRTNKQTNKQTDKQSKKTRLLAWPYVTSRPHLPGNYDRLVKKKKKKKAGRLKWGGGDEKGDGGGGGGGGTERGISE